MKTHPTSRGPIAVPSSEELEVLSKAYDILAKMNSIEEDQDSIESALTALGRILSQTQN